ncbi:hypothetical protein ACROYT_G016596 [Oculina patagonica]
MAAAISGIIIWFLDHKANSGHFPKSFWNGTREGLWWAIVTMTTVGYGDKTPKSFMGRAYASLWMIIGMLLMSSITAQISSTITTDGLRPLDEEFGHKIGIPNGSKEFFETHSEGAKLKEYPTKDELFLSLQDGKKRHREFDKCLKKWAQNIKADDNDEDEEEVEVAGEEDEIDSLLEQVASTILEEKEWESKTPEQQSRCIEHHSYGKYHDAKWTPPQMELVDILLYITAGLLITLLTTGAMWDSCLKIRHARRACDNNVDIEKAVGAQELQTSAVFLN